MSQNNENDAMHKHESRRRSSSPLSSVDPLSSQIAAETGTVQDGRWGSASRPAKPLPYEIQEHCTIYFEEGLYNQALTFLSSLVASGAASADPRPAYVPSLNTLRLISTLAVHPNLTLRAKFPEQLQAANASLHYLRNVLQAVGPLQSKLAEAFAFAGTDLRGSRRKRPNRESLNDRHSGVGIYDADTIENELAKSQSLFAQAEHFWQVVGWAFNCSHLHKKRWERWGPWLEFMVDLLEADWNSREDQEQEKAESLIVRYVVAGGGQSDSGRRILRAIFADGQSTANGEFSEIWRNETKEQKAQKSDDGRRQDTENKGIDMEADDYGDYISDGEGETFLDGHADFLDADTASSPPTASPVQFSSIQPSPSVPLGGPQALALRYRLLALLSAVTYAYPQFLHPTNVLAFPSSLPASRHRSRISRGNAHSQNHTLGQASGGNDVLSTLYTTISSNLRSHALPTFHILFTPPTLLAAFPPDAASVLTQVLLHRCSLIEAAAPEPYSYVLDNETLVENYLPWAANTSNDKTASSAGDLANYLGVNEAKVSLCLETLLRLLDEQGGGVKWSAQLEKALEDGIARRHARLIDAVASVSPPKTPVASKPGPSGRGRGRPSRGRGRVAWQSHTRAQNGDEEVIGGNPGELANTYLRESAERMRLILSLAKEREHEAVQQKV